MTDLHKYYHNLQKRAEGRRSYFSLFVVLGVVCTLGTMISHVVIVDNLKKDFARKEVGFAVCVGQLKECHKQYDECEAEKTACWQDFKDQYGALEKSCTTLERECLGWAREWSK